MNLTSFFFYPQVYDMPCKAMTKNGDKCRMKTNQDFCRNHQQGAGLWDDTKAVAKKVVQFSPFTRRVAAVASGHRTKPSSKLQKFLDAHKDNRVVKLELGRKPIVKPVQAALDAISLGRFSAKQKELNYDEVYHQYLLVTLDNGKTYKLEKNQQIVSQPANQSDYKTVWDIPLKGKTDLTLPAMFAQASKDNEARFYRYRGDVDNCQRYTRDMIEKNGLMPDGEAPKHLELQDTKALMGTLPAATKAIPNLVTDAAALADRFVTGDGVGIIKRPKFVCPL